MRTDINTTAVVSGKTGRIHLTTDFDIRDLLEHHLKGFVDPRWQDTADEDGATRSLANSLACVPQIAEAIINLMIYRSTEDGDSMNDVVLLELRRRLSNAIGAEGAAFGDVVVSLAEAKREIASLRQDIDTKSYRIRELEGQLVEAESARKAANTRLDEARKEVGELRVKIAEQLTEAGDGK